MKAVFFFLLVGLLASQVNSEAHAEVSSEAPASQGDYEIDYEEELDSETATEADTEAAGEIHSDAIQESAPSRRAYRAKINKGTSSSGTRSVNRFAPVSRSDERSVYQKDGKRLDVDTD